MVVIKNKVNFTTGERASGHNPADPNYITHPSWQSPRTGWEIAMVMDKEESDFAGVADVEVVPNESRIESILSSIPTPVAKTQYLVRSEILMVESIKARNIKLETLDHTKPTEELYADLYALGVLGIDEVKPATGHRKSLKVAEIVLASPKMQRKDILKNFAEKLKKWQTQPSKPHA